LAIESPKVVLLGKGDHKHTNEMLDLLNTIEPSYIPSNLIDSVYVTLVDQSKFKIDEKFFKAGIHYESIEEHLRTMNMKEVDTIEIVVDLEKTSAYLKSDAGKFLKQFFKDDPF